jgi:hypothetical protein
VYRALKSSGMLKFVLKKLGFSGAEAAAEGGGEVVAAAGGEALAGEIAAGSIAAAPETGGISLLGLLGSGALVLGGSYGLGTAAHKMFGKKDDGGASGVGGAGNIGIHDMIDKQAAALGIDPLLAHALAKAENSSESQYDSYGNLIYGRGSDGKQTSAVGVYQIIRKTAATLGIDATKPDQNIKGGLTLFSQLLKKYGGNIPEAVGAYHEGEPAFDAFRHNQGPLSVDAQSEIAKVARSMGAHGDIHVGSIVIHLDKPGHTNAQVGSVIKDKLSELRNTKRIQRNLYQAQDYGTAT